MNNLFFLWSFWVSDHWSVQLGLLLHYSPREAPRSGRTLTVFGAKQVGIRWVFKALSVRTAAVERDSSKALRVSFARLAAYQWAETRDEAHHFQWHLSNSTGLTQLRWLDTCCETVAHSTDVETVQKTSTALGEMALLRYKYHSTAWFDCFLCFLLHHPHQPRPDSSASPPLLLHLIAPLVKFFSRF